MGKVLYVLTLFVAIPGQNIVNFVIFILGGIVINVLQLFIPVILFIANHLL